MSNKTNLEGHIFTPEQERVLEAVKEDAPSKLPRFRKAYATLSLRAAIDAKCIDCMAYQQAEVKKCPSNACPLWNVRPYQPRKK